MTPHRIASLLTILAAGGLAACGGGHAASGLGGGLLPQAVARGTVATNVYPPPTAPPDAPGHTNVVPPLPASGQSRPGTVYNVYIQQTATTDTVAFTVFEPSTVTGGETYPLVLEGHGWGSSRVTSLSTPESLGQMGPIATLVANGYGVISLDERGWGETTGKIRSMDPDWEGRDDLAILNWAQAKLGWLAYGPTLDGADPHEPIVGSTGGSYGGMYQLMLLDIDARHRLRAIVPQFTPYDLNYSLVPGGVAKNGWGQILFGIGMTEAQNTALTAPRANLSPPLVQAEEDALTTDTASRYDADFNAYHSQRFWCTGQQIATNGIASVPMRTSQPPPKINALLFQGMRDTLFNFNEAFANYTCLAHAGGDVRLLTYQFGHNNAHVIADPGETLYQPANNDANRACGQVDVSAATLAFFNQYLKGIANAAASIPTSPCISLSAGDAVTVPAVTRGHSGTQVAIAATPVVAGASLDVPTAIDLGIVAPPGGTVLAGIPHAALDVEPAAGVNPVGVPVIFVGIGQMRAAHPGVWDLVDNQVIPVRGTGTHDFALAGISQRLAAGDRLALLLFGNHDQYFAQGNTLQVQPAVVPVTVGGTLWVPVLGPLPSI